MPTLNSDTTPVGDIRIQSYRVARDNLRPLFELAEDSAAELNSYIDAGRVLVAMSGTEVIGHLQLTDTDDPWQAEIKNMAVRETFQGRGVGRRLVQAAVGLVAAEGVTTLLVATAAADIGNLRFYQRQGFRMRSIERDAFTAATGYPPGIRVDGIELRDRVWLDRAVTPSLSLWRRNDWTIPSLAAAIGVSRATLARRFPAQVGSTLAAYLTRWRMDLAAVRLRDTDDTVSAIARSVGYTSEYAFNRAFTRARHIPPGRYRTDSRATWPHNSRTAEPNQLSTTPAMMSP